MFEQTFTATQQTKRERAIVLVLIAQTILVAGVGLLPLLGVQALGPVRQIFAMPPMQVTASHVEKTQVQAVSRAKPIFNVRSLVDIHKPVAVVQLGPIGLPAPLAMGSSLGPTSNSFGVPGIDIQPAPPVKPKPEPKPAHPVRLTSMIAQSQLIYSPKPAYPRLAIAARSQGTVRLQAIISREGKIENLHVLTGPALLVNAAMEAVQAWRYKPLLLNGEAVEVITEIEVVFTLQR